MVTLTMACATRSGLVVDLATIWIGKVPPCRPAAGVTETIPVLLMVTVQPSGTWAVRVYASARLVFTLICKLAGVFWLAVIAVGVADTVNTFAEVPLRVIESVAVPLVSVTVPL